jgi:hypothetical protein
MEIIIEEISRGHKLIGRHKFLKQSVSIGRGYQNDIIVSDPHVCSDHLSVEFDGEHWLVTDSGSINGSFIEDSKDLLKQHRVQSGDIITLGKSQIRIVFPNHPVEESVTFSPFENLVDIARHPITLICSVVLFAFVSGFLYYLNSPKEVTFTQLLVPSIKMTLIFAMWPAGIAIVSLLTKHDTRILSQLGVCFVFFNLMWMNDILERFVQFNVSSQWPFMWLLTLIPIGLAFCLFWFNTSIGFHTTKQRRMAVSIGLTVLLFGGSALIKLSKKPDFIPFPRYNATLMTPDFHVTSSSSVDEFVEDSAKLFKRVNKKAKED